MTAGNLLFRADANTAMGTGHVTRCLALAQAWQDEGGQVVFAMADATFAVEERLQREGVEIVRLDVFPGEREDAQQTAGLARDLQAVWVVVDGYQFGSDYQKLLKDAEQQILFVDDNGHAEHYCADIVLNQNLHATEDLYPHRQPYTRLLLGPRYAMLRREFNRWRGQKRSIPLVAKKVVVTLGGSDPQNITHAVLDALHKVQVEGLELLVVVGGSNPHLPSLRNTFAESAMDIQFIADPTNMAELMLSADLAIAGAGCTSWEICFLGLPTVLVELAANQHALATQLDELGAAIRVTTATVAAPLEIVPKIDRLIRSPETRRRISERAHQLVDGNGTARVLAFLKGDVCLRPTEASDCRQLWEWANDPEVRAASFTTEPITWERHMEWFAAKLSDPCGALYVATDRDGTTIGQVRYQVHGDRAVLSVNLGAEFRGKGYGREMLYLSTEDFFRRSKVARIDAFVKPENEASVRLFERAGFQRAGLERRAGHPAMHFVLPMRVVG